MTAALHERVRLLPRDVWLQQRRHNNTIGGSDIACILGTSPWRGPWDVWASKRYDQSEELTPAKIAQFRRGHRWEQMIVGEYIEGADENTSVQTAPGDQEMFIRHGSETWAAASPDGLVVFTNTRFLESVAESLDPVGGLESKTDVDGRKNWGETGTVVETYTAESARLIPNYYAVQASWYMLVTGLPWWDFAVAIPRAHDFPEVRVLRLLADEGRQERLLNRVGEWRHKHLTNGTEPPTDASKGCRKQLARQFPGKQGKETRAANDAETELAYHLASLKGQKSNIEQQIMHTENRIAWALKDEYGLHIEGTRARVLWSPGKGRATIDMDKLRKQFPEAAEACTKPGKPTRTFRLSGFKE